MAMSIIYIYHIDTSVLPKNIPLVKFIKTASGTRVVFFIAIINNEDHKLRELLPARHGSR